ncbi:hypothetical protein JW835_13195 [bacterium]|nr:hypothetical protein [bacterium]
MHSMPSRRLYWMFLCILIIRQPLLPQQAKIIKAIGRIAVIDAGISAGIRVGNYFTVYRHVGARWKPFTYVQVTKSSPRLARVELVPVAPKINLQTGDRVLPAKLSKKTRESLSRMNQPELLVPKRNSSTGIKGVYLGPSTGLFMPLGEMEDVFETTYSYGGVLGLQFRPDLDVNARFLYTVHGDEWSLWNIQLLGRRYAQDGFMFDLGYGILYPQIWEGGYISLGFCGGLGYTFPIAYNTWFEFGVLYSYYPHFIRNTAQFITMELRLIL